MRPDPDGAVPLVGEFAQHGRDELVRVWHSLGNGHAAEVALDRLRAGDEQFVTEHALAAHLRAVLVGR